MERKKINLPTKITIFRIVLAAVLILGIFVLYLIDYFAPFVANFNIYFFNGNDEKASINIIMIVICAIFLFASFTDFLDGYIARKYDMVTDLGKFLDPIADKMLINGLMIFLILGFSSFKNMVRFPFFLVVLMEIRDLIIDGLRFMAAKKNIVIAANIFGKIKTVMQMIAITIVLLNGFPFNLFDYNFPIYLHISDFLCYIATFFSLLSGFIYLKRNFRRVFSE